MTETKFKDEFGNEIQFIRMDSEQKCEVIMIKRDMTGKFISHGHYFYISDKLQEWFFYSESGEIISRHTIEFCSDIWDAWHKDFDSTGDLLKQTFYTWDKSYQAKAELYYDAADEYLGKKVHSSEGGNYHPLYFDKKGNLISPSDAHNSSVAKSSTNQNTSETENQ